MKMILLFLIFSPFYTLLSQNIKGKVVNDIDRPVAGVSIYLDGTKTGTVSGADGSFILNLISKNNNNLVFRKDGYETFTINTSEVLNKTLKVVMIKAQEIEEVRIIPFTEKAYRDYINFFLSSFIGEDKINVKIKNQRSLKFSYDKNSKILRVKAPQTLIIINKNLGYTIDYDLEEFVADFEQSTIRYTGTSFFRETKNSDKVRLNRMNAYDGSQTHFLRSVYTGKAKEEGFVVNEVTKFPNPKYPTEEELKRLKDFSSNFKPGKTIVVPEDIQEISRRKSNEPPYNIGITKTQIAEADYTRKSGEKLMLDFKDMLQINYSKYLYQLRNKNIAKIKIPLKQTSYLHSEGNIFQIYADGNTSDPALLTNQGYFSRNKIEFLLPLEYQLGD